MNFRSELERRKGERRQVCKTLEETRTNLENLQGEEKNLRDAQAIVQCVAQATQEKLRYHISKLVSLALEAVFDDPYQLNLDFVLKRNRSEAELTFSRDDGDKVHPMSASGGGAVDVAAFALRVSLWNLERPRSRNVIVLDEPFRFLSSDLQPKASEMLKQISSKLGIQFIVITHEEELLDCADRVFHVGIHNGVSKVVAT